MKRSLLPPKENDIVRFRKNGDVYVGKVVCIGESMGEDYYICSSEDRTHVILPTNIIEIVSPNENSNQ